MSGPAAIPRLRRRLARWVAVLGLLASLVPLTLWAVPSTHRRPIVHLTWTDGGGSQVTQWIVRKGYDRHGLVHQEQTLIWSAATPAALADVRAAHHRDPRLLVNLPPAESWRPQWTEYGNNHVYLPHGLMLIDAGLLRTTPYALIAAVLAAPAAAWGAMAAWRHARGNRTGVAASAATDGGLKPPSR